MEHRKICVSHKVSNDNLQQADLLRSRLESALQLVDKLAGPRVQEVSAEGQPVDQQAIRALIKARRNRAHFFESELFADPAWDILLELYAAELGNYRVSVTALCAGACVPATTATRWIALLESKGLITRQADPLDGRRYFVLLRSETRSALESYFRTVPIGTPII